MMSPEDPFAQLWGLAIRTASHAGFEFAPHCESLVREFVRDGVVRMGAQGVLDDPASLRKADRNLVRFVEGMITTARDMGSDVLHEGTFGGARNRFCPLWPFC